MRKTYKRPEVVIVEIDPCYMFASSIVIYSNSKGDFDEDFVREYHRRGTWGNLWKETDKTKD